MLTLQSTTPQHAKHNLFFPHISIHTGTYMARIVYALHAVSTAPCRVSPVSTVESFFAFTAVVFCHCPWTLWSNTAQLTSGSNQYASTLLDQFPGLTLLAALFQSARQDKIARIAAFATHNRCFLPIVMLETYCATLKGSPLWHYVQPRPFSTSRYS